MNFDLSSILILAFYSGVVSSVLVEEESRKRLADEIFARVNAQRRIERAGRPIRILSYVSKSAAFQSLTITEKISFSEPFFFSLVNLPEEFQTNAFQTSRPSEAQDENKVHHPYFITELGKLVQSATDVGLELRQQVYWSKSGRWLKMDDGTAGVEPDFCFVERMGSDDKIVPSNDKVRLPHSKYAVTVALEQKKKIMESDQIEAIDYGERLLAIQRGRSVSYAALFQVSNEMATIRWIRVFIDNDNFKSQISRPERMDIAGGVGQRQLLTILSKSASELGLTTPKFSSDIQVQLKLQEGATSDVYSAKRGEEQVVLKVLKHGFEMFAEYEAQVVARLVQHNVPGIVMCDCVKSFTNAALVMHDLPFHIDVVTSDHVGQLLACLKGAHEAGVIHRDIRPENIMLDEGGRARIIDWGAAHVTDHAVEEPFQGFVGTFRYGSDEVLGALISSTPRPPQPKDDLESLVRVVLAINSVTILRELASLEQGDFAGARDYWRRKRASNASQDFFFEAAASCNYEALQQLVF